MKNEASSSLVRNCKTYFPPFITDSTVKLEISLIVLSPKSLFPSFFTYYLLSSKCATTNIWLNTTVQRIMANMMADTITTGVVTTWVNTATTALNGTTATLSSTKNTVIMTTMAIMIMEWINTDIVRVSEENFSHLPVKVKGETMNVS